MARREYSIVQNEYVEDGLIFHAPLTSDNVDVIGGKTPISGFDSPISYSDRGALFNYNQAKHLIYDFTQDFALNVKTIYYEIERTGSSTRNMFPMVFGCYVPEGLNSDGTYQNKNGTYIMSNYITTAGKLGNTCQLISETWAKDIESTYTISQNIVYKIAITITPQKNILCFVNGGMVLSNSTNPSTPVNDVAEYSDKMYQPIGLCIGGRANYTSVSSSLREFQGYIRNVKIYNYVLSDTELSQITE